MKNILNQFCLGAWSAMAVGMGIMSKSWETFFSFMLIAAFFAVGFLASAIRRDRAAKGQPHRIATAISYTHLAAIVLLMVGGFIFTAERIYLGSSEHYSQLLVSRDLGPTDERGLLEQTRTLCPKGGTTIYYKADDQAVIRCGFMWYEGKTYTATVTGRKS